MEVKDMSAVLVLTLVAGWFLIPGDIRAQDCLDYSDYLHWVTVENLPIPSNAVVIVGDLAYVANGQDGMHIVDISLPDDPAVVGAVTLPGSAKDIAVEGMYAYVASGNDGLQVVDVANHSAPVLVGVLETPAFASHVVLYAHYALVAEFDTGRVHVVDVTEPTVPVIVGGVDAADDIRDLVVADGHAHVLYHVVHPGTAGLQIFDLANPELPQLVVDFPVQDWAQAVAVTGDRAYVVGGGVGLQVIDIADPTTPATLGQTSLPGGGKEVAVVDNHAYIGLNIGYSGLVVVDVSLPESPQVTGVATTRDESRGIAVRNQHAYLANTYTGLNVFDISVPVSPTPVGAVDSPVSALTIDVEGSYIYLAGYYDVSVQAVDISEPAAPLPLGTLHTPGLAWDISVTGQVAYVADDSTGLHVVDVSDPESLEILAVVGPRTIRGVEATPEYLYVIYVDSSQLQVMDISVPTIPQVVGAVEVSPAPRSITRVGNQVYLTDSMGLTVVDVADPTLPAVVGVLDVPGSNHYDAAVEGSLAFVSSNTYPGPNLQVIDVSDPTAPGVVGTVSLPGSARSIAAQGNHVYLAVKEIGLVVVDVVDPAHGFVVGIVNVGASHSSPTAVAFASDHVYLTSGGDLQVCLQQCADVVPVYLVDFVVTRIDAVVQLQWSVHTTDDTPEFQVVARQGDQGWQVPHHRDEHGGYFASDRDVPWVPGEPRIYSLFHRTAGADWTLLACETVDPEIVVPVSGLQNIQPNPFNPQTSVSFTVSRGQHVQVAIHDLAGRRVALLADRLFSAGEHTIPWDGRDIAGRAAASGTYVVRFVTEDRTESRKMMLVR